MSREQRISLGMGPNVKALARSLHSHYQIGSLLANGELAKFDNIRNIHVANIFSFSNPHFLRQHCLPVSPQFSLLSFRCAAVSENTCAVEKITSILN